MVTEKGMQSRALSMELIENWNKVQHNKGFSAAILMDLSKAFDTINHDPLIAKLDAYGLRANFLNHIKNYLTNRYK